MSAYVLDRDEINLLTVATDAMIRMNRRYPGSYVLHPDTVKVLGSYDLHNIYRALYIANIKAVNGRYGEDAKTLPKYTALREWDIDRLNPTAMKNAAKSFRSYMYQIAEEPIIYSSVWYSFSDVYKLLCTVINRGH